MPGASPPLSDPPIDSPVDSASDPAGDPAKDPRQAVVDRLLGGQALLADSPTHVMEVVGILHSYGIVLDAYSKNLLYIANEVFLEPFTFFKYFNGEISPQKLLRHWNHDRINFEYAEYCMKTMFWHGGGRFDTYLDSPEFVAAARSTARAFFPGNWLVALLDRLFPDFLVENVRQQCYYSALGQFWRVMSDMFMSLSAGYDAGTIQTIPQVVQHIQDALVAAAAKPITYSVQIRGQDYPLIPPTAGMQFLMDTAVPYVEAVFLRGTPFLGTVSFNAQVTEIPFYQSGFTYGALYADPLPVGGSGIPPTLLMQDMRHFLPVYLQEFYQNTLRQNDDLLVKICATFQKSMFCVTTAALRGLAPRPIDSPAAEDRAANREFLLPWIDRLATSRLGVINQA